MPGFGGALIKFGQRFASNPKVRQVASQLATRYGSRLGTAARVGGKLVAGGAAFTAGSRLVDYVGGAFDDNGYSTGRRRRINPLNARAATRAIRRIGLVRKQLRKIESKLPKAKCRRCSSGGGYPWRKRKC